MSSDDKKQAYEPSRRKFVKNTGLVIGGLAGGSLLGGLVVDMNNTEPSNTTANIAEDSYREARMFFTRQEDFNVLEAATERIYPENKNGPGAIGLRVPYFIDGQLAGDFGSNRKDYMIGPFKENKYDHLYQTRMNRGEVFIEGLRKMNVISKDKYDVDFHDADGKQQDTILQSFDNDEIELEGVSSKTFFNLLRKMTIEGAYSDPLYGGNKDMQGWKMREYPGPRAAYSDLIESEEFVELDPISLKDYQS
ncbi:gluconate 2-dehydrogenase subunit 3 family protein [Virgibacillus sp. NKC19-3]|nr:gluconate 2-dehydrogenase subunit 3 family protein [Virgibacillus sp. NKC19-3]